MKNHKKWLGVGIALSAVFAMIFFIACTRVDENNYMLPIADTYDLIASIFLGLTLLTFILTLIPGTLMAREFLANRYKSYKESRRWYRAYQASRERLKKK